jgi:hypothetical protein
MLLYGGQNFSIERAIVLFSYLSYLLQKTFREPDSERLNLIFHTTILSSIWLYVKRLQYPCAQAPQKDSPLIPMAKARGFLARVMVRHGIMY